MKLQINRISILKKIQLGEKIFPVERPDSQLNFSFYCVEGSIKHEVVLSLEDSNLLSDLIEKEVINKDDLVKNEVDKRQNIENNKRLFPYRYQICSFGKCNNLYIMIFSVNEYRDNYSYFVYAVLQIEKTPFSPILFFDGLKSHTIKNQYDDWFSATDYSVWSNSYIEVENKRIYIIKENVRTLSTHKYFDKEELELLAAKYYLKIKESNGIHYCFTDGHNLSAFEISENETHAVIYSLEGGNAPESIFIYGVYQK